MMRTTSFVDTFTSIIGQCGCFVYFVSVSQLFWRKITDACFLLLNITCFCWGKQNHSILFLRTTVLRLLITYFYKDPVKNGDAILISKRNTTVFIIVHTLSNSDSPTFSLAVLCCEIRCFNRLRVTVFIVWRAAS
jgi:hypothetical protein